MEEKIMNYETSKKYFYDAIKIIDDKISEENEQYKKIMDALEYEKRKLKESMGDLELKYHIFDNLVDPHNDKQEDYFTERDIYFYKWVEAMTYIGCYKSVFAALSKRKYHAPEKFKIEDIRPLTNYCVICILKKPIVINNKVIRGVQLMLLNKLALNVYYYTNSTLVYSLELMGENIYYGFLKEHPEINDSDKYAISYEQTKMETELLRDVLKSDHETTAISENDANVIMNKLQTIMDAVTECSNTIKSIMESDK